MSWHAPELPAVFWLALAWLALECVDVATGWLAAYVTHTISSKVSGDGIARKALRVLLVVAVGIVNAISPAPLDGIPLLVPVLFGFVGTTLVSIFENAKRAGVTLPGHDRLADRKDFP